MAVQPNLPKWSTPERRAKLIDLFTRSGGFCVFGEKRCLIPEHHYSLFIEDLIDDWKQADREQRSAEWLAELKALHDLGEQRYPLTGRFNAISKDIFFDKQPLYYIQGLGISGLTFKPFAKVRLPSSYMRLYVDLGETLRGMSKNKKRKAIRYGKPLSESIENAVNRLVGEAVRHYLDY